MGIYVYRVTNEKVKCSDGVDANVAEYAYKPYMSIFEQDTNRKMHWKSGAQASDNMASRGNVSGRISIHGSVYMNRDRVGSFYDSDLGSMALERLPEVHADPFPPKKLWRDVVVKGREVSAIVGEISEADGIKYCMTATLKRELIAGLSAVFSMTCKFPGGAKPLSHTLSVAQTDMPRLHVHWAGFLHNARSRANELYYLKEKA